MKYYTITIVFEIQNQPARITSNFVERSFIIYYYFKAHINIKTVSEYAANPRTRALASASAHLAALITFDTDESPIYLPTLAVPNLVTLF